MSRTLRFGHVNVRSLLAHFDDLSEIVIENGYDLFGVSETWLSEHIPNAAIDIPGYTIVRRDRATRGGGVALYIAQHLRYVNVCDAGFVDDDVEQIWVLLSIMSKTFAFGCMYRSPSSNVSTFLDKLGSALCHIQGVSDFMYCVGDININMLDFGGGATMRFNILLDELSLDQVINLPTRTTTTSASLIDCLITNNSESCTNQINRPLDISDHNLIQCDIVFSSLKSAPMVRLCRNVSGIDDSLLRRDLACLPLHNIYHINDINQKVNFLSSHLSILLNLHAPARPLKFAKPFTPWITSNVKLMMKLRDQALGKFRRTKLAPHFDYYKSLRNLVTSAIRREKKVYFNSTFKNMDVQSSWRLLNRLNIGKKSRPVIPAHLHDVNKINDYFLKSVGHTDVDAALLTFYNTNNLFAESHDGFSFKIVDTSTIISALNGIKSTAAGADEINIIFIRKCLPDLLPYIVHIVNSCLEQSIFPDAWKSAVVMPLPKKVNPCNFEDLRPISIFPVLSKVLERCMEIQLRTYMDEHNVLPPIQSGFRPSYSCATALLNVTDDLLKARDDGQSGVVVLLDYSKAFDKVNHRMLLALLHYVGMSDSAASLINSFLSDRVQVVRLDEESSAPLPVKAGVPQGSLLAPLLFTLYTSQLHKCVTHSSVHMYADDTQLYLTFRREHTALSCTKLNVDLLALSEYSIKLALTLNPTKSTILTFGNLSSHNVNISLNGERLVVSPESRNLGVVFDSNFRFSTHVTTCIKKAYAALRCLYRHRQVLNSTTKRYLCETLVLSNFVHCAAMYGPCLMEFDMHRIQKVQNSCLRFIYGIRKHESISHTLRCSGWLNIRNRFKYYFLCLANKVVTTKTPPYLYNKITFRTDIHNLNLRHKSTITMPAHKTALFKRSFSYRIAKEYNACPSNLKNKRPDIFKIKLRDALLTVQGSQQNAYAASMF